MNFTDLIIKKYELPLAKPLTIKNQTINSRSGFIVSLTDDQGNIGYGEAAPLPGLHAETIQDVISQLKQIEPSAISPFLFDSLFPTTRTALEMAMFDLRWQSSKALDKFHNTKLPLNGLVMAQDQDLFNEVENLINDGYISIKIKVGRQPLAKDIETIQRLQKLIGDKATIRLDANRLWTLDQAVQFCNHIDPDRIEYIEEPLKDISEYPRFFESSDIPVAFDETLTKKNPEKLHHLNKIKAFILKPSLLGGLIWTSQFIEVAYENKITPVMSCTFQSDLSLRSFALFAAMFGITETPLGLDTIKWFAKPLLNRGFKVASGHIDIATLTDRPVFNEQLLQDVK